MAEACNEFVSHTNLTQIDRCGRCGKHRSTHDGSGMQNGVHKPADLSQPQQVATAETLAKDQQITQATNAALPGIGIAIDQLRSLLPVDMPMAEEGICYALLVQACGMAKANGWPIQLLGTALGQAWRMTNVTAGVKEDEKIIS